MKQWEWLETLAVHPPHGPLQPGEPLVAPLDLSTSFQVGPDAGFTAGGQEAKASLVYARWGNPTVHALERHLASLERAEDALCFGSGMAAISALLLHHAGKGRHVVASNICYAGAAELLHRLIADYGLAVTFVDSSDEQAVASAVSAKTSLVYIETPANPILRLSNIQALARIAHEAGAKLAVDSTFATPVATRPIEHGADFVLHSLTKYMSGHGDALGGVIAGPGDAISRLRSSELVHLGAVLHPMAAWLITRSIQTLPLRMERHQANAFAVAQFLESHPSVGQLFYPGLASHPQHALARAQMDNYSGMLAFRTERSDEVKRRLASGGGVISYALSLGKTKSLIFYVETSEVQNQSFHLPGGEYEKYRSWAGDGVFRMSVGLEHPDDIIDELGRALD